MNTVYTTGIELSLLTCLTSILIITANIPFYFRITHPARILSCEPAIEDGGNSSDLASLFSKSVRKPLPVYDNAAVPARGAVDTAIAEILGGKGDKTTDVKVKLKKEIQRHDRMGLRAV